MGMGSGGWAMLDGGLGMGDWAQSPIPNPQSPNPIYYFFFFIKKKLKLIYIKYLLYFIK